MSAGRPENVVGTAAGRAVRFTDLFSIRGSPRFRAGNKGPPMPQTMSLKAGRNRGNAPQLEIGGPQSANVALVSRRPRRVLATRRGRCAVCEGRSERG